MIIDVHSHIAPKQLLERHKSYTLDAVGEGRYVIKTSRFDVPVDEFMFSPEAQIQKMDEQGIDKKAICLPPFLFGLELQPEESAAWIRGSNECIAEICRRYPDRFIGFCTLPLLNPQDALKELDYCVRSLGLSGVEIGTHCAGTNLDDDCFTPVFSKIDEMKLPVLVHPNDVRGDMFSGTNYCGNVFGNLCETAVLAARFLSMDFFEKFPEINVCLSHGGGALPFLLGRLGRKRPDLRAAHGKIALPKRMFVDIVVFDDEVLRFLVSVCGADRIVLGSDHPFDMEEPDPVRFVKNSLDAQTAQKILHETPLRFLRQDKPKG